MRTCIHQGQPLISVSRVRREERKVSDGVEEKESTKLGAWFNVTSKEKRRHGRE